MSRNPVQNAAQNPPPVWYTRVIAEQTVLINKIDADPSIKEWLIKTLTDQFETECPICHLNGHDPSNCSINAQMYAKTRSKPEHQMAWWLVK